MIHSAKQWRDQLLALRNGLREIAASAEAGSETVELDQSRVGRLSRMDAMQMQAMSKASDVRRGVQLRSIEAALLRLDRDEFGVCVTCDEEIAAARLQADPTVLTCIDCASKAEG